MLDAEIRPYRQARITAPPSHKSANRYALPDFFNRPRLPVFPEQAGRPHHKEDNFLWQAGCLRYNKNR